MLAVLSIAVLFLKSIISSSIKKDIKCEDEERRKEFEKIAKQMIEQWEEAKRRDDE